MKPKPRDTVAASGKSYLIPDVALGRNCTLPVKTLEMFDTTAAEVILEATKKRLADENNMPAFLKALNVIPYTIILCRDPPATDGEVIDWASSVAKSCQSLLDCFENASAGSEALRRAIAIFTRWNPDDPPVYLNSEKHFTSWPIESLFHTLEQVSQIKRRVEFISKRQKPRGARETATIELRVFSDIRRAYKVAFASELTAGDRGGRQPGPGQRFCSAILAHLALALESIPALSVEREQFMRVNTPARIAARVQETSGPDVHAPLGWRTRDRAL